MFIAEYEKIIENTNEKYENSTQQWLEEKEVLSGYIIEQAHDLDAARACARFARSEVVRLEKKTQELSANLKKRTPKLNKVLPFLSNSKNEYATPGWFSKWRFLFFFGFIVAYLMYNNFFYLLTSMCIML